MIYTEEWMIKTFGDKWYCNGWSMQPVENYVRGSGFVVLDQEARDYIAVFENEQDAIDFINMKMVKA